MQTNTLPSPGHFKGKDATQHVIENQARGLLSKAEMHGTEAPGHVMAAADSARDTAIVILLLLLLKEVLQIKESLASISLLGFIFGWLVWKTGRSTWLAWCRLERLHRVMAEEKWEIEHHRSQEREELGALYKEKGFQGKLLEDVLDVLMSDGDRLLKVMLEEELGLSLENQEHPLKQGLGAFFGAIGASLFVIVGELSFGAAGASLAAFLVVAIAAYITASYEKNRLIPAVTWSLGLGIAACGSSYFLVEFLKSFIA